MTKKTKITALIAALILLLSLSPVNAIEPEAEMVAQIQDIPVTSYGLPIEDIPEVFSTDTAEEGGFTERLRDEELQENTVVFRNADGTNTMLFYAQDIWYETEDGVKEDYNTNITETENGFENISGDKTVRFPEKLSDGVFYSEKGFSVTFTPSEDKVVSTPIEYENEAVPEDEIMSSEEIEAKEAAGEYDAIINQPEEELTEEEMNALFDETNYKPYSQMSENTLEKHGNAILEWLKRIFEQKGKYNDGKKIEYGDISLSPLLHGVKQDTVITSPEKNSFSFKVALDGLTPLNSTGYSIPLADETGKVRGYINTECDIDCPQITDIAAYEDGSYLVTVTFDADTLTEASIQNGEPNTLVSTYIHISDYYIYDTYISSQYKYTNYNTSPQLLTGYYGGTCHAYMQFRVGNAFNNISPDSVCSESLILTNNSYGTTTTRITPKIPNHTWDNTDLIWDDIIGLNPEYTSSRNGVPAQSATNVNLSSSITSISTNTNGLGDGLISAFIRDNINPNLSRTLSQYRGIVLINSYESSSHSAYCYHFKSANASTGLPYATLTYTNVGAALPFRTCTSTTVNCWGYAIECSQFIVEPYEPDGYGIVGKQEYFSHVSDKSKQYLQQEGKNYEFSLSNANNLNEFSINSNQYRVICRYYNKTSYEYSQIEDYHYIVQTSSGEWAEKMNISSAHILLNYDDSDNYWQNVIHSYYTSPSADDPAGYETLYIKVERNSSTT